MFAHKLDKMSRYESLIEKHLNNYRGRGFRFLNDRVHCDFCEYSIKIDKTHIKTQLSSHLKSQKHQKNETIKAKLKNVIRKPITFCEQISQTCCGSDAEPFRIQNDLLTDLKDSLSDQTNVVFVNTGTGTDGDNGVTSIKDMLHVSCEATSNNECPLTTTAQSFRQGDDHLRHESIYFHNKQKSQTYLQQLQRHLQLQFEQLTQQMSTTDGNQCSRQTNQLEKLLLKKNTNRIRNVSLNRSNHKPLQANVFNHQSDYENERSSNIHPLLCNAISLANRTSTAASVSINSVRNSTSSGSAVDTDGHLTPYSSYKRLLVAEPHQHVIHLKLNRAKKRNAIDDIMFKELRDCFTRLNRDRHFRSIVLSGDGNCFTSGIDLGTLQSKYPTDVDDVARKALELRNSISELQDCMLAVGHCQKPVIAAIAGACIGAGVDLISFTDIRYCTQQTYFSVREVDLGLAADIGTLQTLPRIVGNQSFVREIVFTGRNVSAEEAREMGIVSRVLPCDQTLHESAIELARQIAAKSPIAVQGTKVCLDYSREHGIWDGLKFTGNWNMAMLQSEDLFKATMSVVSKNEDPVEFNDL